MSVIPVDEYWATLLHKRAMDEDISNVLNITGVLSLYARENISKSQHKDVAIHTLFSSKWSTPIFESMLRVNRLLVCSQG